MEVLKPLEILGKAVLQFNYYHQTRFVNNGDEEWKSEKLRQL